MQQFGFVLTLLAVMPIAFAQGANTRESHALAPKILTRIPMDAHVKTSARDLADALNRLSPEQRALLTDRIDAMTRLDPAGAASAHPLYLPFDNRHPLDFDQDQSSKGTTDNG
ncbi:hypothetical protein [Beijerinckia sp. L45]|uniref:hypothetical protein n=1 Tax=Beijerinckia sp. L45 TaxID=1641855 RepID=UPI00131D06AD|nr:hypothetical protein [Beijerinckia sp. L45]